MAEPTAQDVVNYLDRRATELKLHFDKNKQVIFELECIVKRYQLRIDRSKQNES